MAEEKEKRNENDKYQGSDQGAATAEGPAPVADGGPPQDSPAATPTADTAAASTAVTTKTKAKEPPKGDGGAAEVKTKRSVPNIIAMAVAVILIVLIIPLVAVTVTMSVKSAIDPDTPPSIFGYAPLAVVSPSMTGDNEDSFDEGDLIFIKILSDEEKNGLQVNDVICFTADDMYITHRIVSITYDENDNDVITSITTMGDANYSADDSITTDVILGIYTGKIKNLGAFAEFLQTPAGIAVFIAVPVMAFIIYDVAMVIIRKKKDEDLSKDEEIARLKKMLNEQGANGGKDAAGADDNAAVSTDKEGDDV